MKALLPIVPYLFIQTTDELRSEQRQFANVLHASFAQANCKECVSLRRSARTTCSASGMRRADKIGQTDEVLMIRVLLVDDQPVVRRALRERFHLEADMQVVGEASTGREALNLAQTLTPDVVLMDIEMPDMDGIQATAALRRVVPQSAVVILSIHDDAQTRGRAQAAGAVAFVEKRGATDSLLAVIRQVARHA
jgi:CheY-like chemotaxis protein